MEEHRFRVNFGDTDLSSWVYSAKYVDYLMNAIFQYVESKGIDWNEIFESGHGLPPVEILFRFRSPAIYGDKIAVFLTITKIGSKSITFAFKMCKGDGTLLNEGTTTLVYTNIKARKAANLPDAFRQRLMNSSTQGPKM